MTVIVADERVIAAAGVVGCSMMAEIGQDGWAAPMVGALTDDCNFINATVLVRQDPGATLEQFFVVVKSILQESIAGGASTVFGCISISVSGKIAGKERDTMAAAVLWADRRGWFGSIFVGMPDGGVGSLGLDSLCKATKDHLFKVFFAELKWPAVN